MLALRNEHRQKAADNQGWCLLTLRVQGEEDQPTHNIEKDEPVSLRDRTTQKAQYPRRQAKILYQRTGNDRFGVVKTEMRIGFSSAMGGPHLFHLSLGAKA